MAISEGRRVPRIVAVVSCCTTDSELSSPTPSLAVFFHNRLALEPGFLQLIGCFEESSGQLLFVTLWQTERDAARFEAGPHSSFQDEFRWMLETK